MARLTGAAVPSRGAAAPLAAPRRLTRAAFLRRVTLAAAAPLAVPAIARSDEDDRAVLNFALLLEDLQVTLYREALELDLGFDLTGLLRTFADHEHEHVERLRALGGGSAEPLRFAYGLETRDELLQLAPTVEDTVVGAYVGAIPARGHAGRSARCWPASCTPRPSRRRHCGCSPPRSRRPPRSTRCSAGPCCSTASDPSSPRERATLARRARARAPGGPSAASWPCSRPRCSPARSCCSRCSRWWPGSSCRRSGARRRCGRSRSCSSRPCCCSATCTRTCPRAGSACTGRSRSTPSCSSRPSSRSRSACRPRAPTRRPATPRGSCSACSRCRSGCRSSSSPRRRRCCSAGSCTPTIRPARTRTSCTGRATSAACSGSSPTRCCSSRG